MKYPKYFWLLKNGEVRELDWKEYIELAKRNWEKQGSFLLCILWESEIAIWKRESVITARLDQLKKILGEAEK